MKKALKNKTLVSVLAIASVVGGTFSVSAESLKEAMAAAYESNPQLSAQRAALRAVDEGVSSARAGFLPNVSGSASHTEIDSTSKESGITLSDNTFNNRNYSATLRQSIFNGFRDQNAIRAAKSQVFAGRAQLLATEQQVLLDAVTAYMDVVRDENILRLNDNQVQVLERQLQASNDRFRVGEITRTDVAQSEARLESAKSQKLTAEANLAASRARYVRVVGRTPASLDTPDGLPALPTSLENAVEEAMASAPGVSAARYNEEAARHSVKQAEGGLLPTLGAQLQISRSEGPSQLGSFSTGDNITTRKTAGIQLTVPLYQGGAEYSAIRRAKQVRSQRMVEIRQAERLAQEAALVAWDRFRAAKAQIVSSEASVRANEIALDGVRQEAAVGSRTTLDVLNAEQELLNARSNLIAARRNEYVAAYSLLSSTGKLTARDLDLDVAHYNPADHFDKVNTKFIGW